MLFKTNDVINLRFAKISNVQRGGGLHKGVFCSPPYQMFLFFAGEQPYMCIYPGLPLLAHNSDSVFFELELLKCGWGNSVC